MYRRFETLSGAVNSNNSTIYEDEENSTSGASVSLSFSEGAMRGEPGGGCFTGDPGGCVKEGSADGHLCP
jgi:hypothetical protein